MIIHIIPENDEERAKAQEVEIKNVKEFFLFGSNVNEDGNRNEFHEWLGSYRYLLGTLTYYYEIINDERRDAQSKRNFSPTLQPPIPPSLRIIEDDLDIPNEADDNDEDKDEGMDGE